MVTDNITLEVCGARKRFGQTDALRGADVRLHAGEWLGLLGPNGAGKTTMVRAIAGRVRLDDGQITLLGQTLAHARPGGARARLGVVPQEIALYPTMTARENLETFGALAGVHGAVLRQQVEWALTFTGLADRARHLAQTFSGGMKRRLNIACAVLHKPDVLLLDEPTVGVDPQSRQRIWDMLETLRSDGTSLLLTTHQLDEAQQMCDRIVIIDDGSVIAEGTMDQLVARTIGAQRVVQLVLDRAPAPDLLDHGASVEGCRALIPVDDVAVELPRILGRVAEAGVGVEDVRVDAPSLHNVFLHLTGKELRE